MSQMTQAVALLQALTQDCIDAWGLTDSKVDNGLKRMVASRLPYAIIDMLPVEMGALAARTVRQDYTFRITYRDEFPASGNILQTKIEKANLLIAAIINGPSYNDIAFLPYITQFDPTEEDDPQQNAYEFSVTFTCSVEENHH